jgi:hypothetical protein
MRPRGIKRGVFGQSGVCKRIMDIMEAHHPGRIANHDIASSRIITMHASPCLSPHANGPPALAARSLPADGLRQSASVRPRHDTIRTRRNQSWRVVLVSQIAVGNICSSSSFVRFCNR